MSIINSRFHRILEVVSNYFFLNMVWLLLCIPVVTIFASTTALFAVVRNWTLKKETTYFLTDFFYHFKTNFIKSTKIGLVWSFVGLVIGLYFYINFQISSPVLFGILIVISIIYLFVSIYLFPILVHYDINIWNTLKFSLIYSISQLVYTILVVLIIFVFLFLLYFQPFLVLIFCSLSAHLVYFVIHKAFDKIMKKNVTSQ